MSFQTSYIIKILIFSFFLELALPPKFPQRERIRSGYVNHLSRACDYFSHQV